ncbi:MAG: hypothetical protein MHPSP_003805, partial [Paramarteilia canceri]
MNAHSNFVDWTDGLTSNVINQTSCICSEGKYINSHSICVDCPKGKFSKLINAKECLKCSFFKTTEGTNSKIELQCNKINYRHLALIVGIIVAILLICVVTIFVVLLKPKRNNQNNNQNNELIIQENEDPNQYKNN